MHTRQRGVPVPQVVAVVVAAAACLAAPFLLWLGPTAEAVACGWTCYIPLDSSRHPHWAVGTGRTGFGVAPPLGVVLLATGLAALACAVLLARRRPAPRSLGPAMALLGVAGFGGSLAVVLTRTAGDTKVLVRHGGAMQPTTGPGAWAALVGTAAAVAIGTALLLRRRRARTGAPAHDPVPAP
jgi:hypothetical protein